MDSINRQIYLLHRIQKAKLIQKLNNTRNKVNDINNSECNFHQASIKFPRLRGGEGQQQCEQKRTGGGKSLAESRHLFSVVSVREKRACKGNFIIIFLC